MMPCIYLRSEGPCNLVANILDIIANLNSFHLITFTFGKSIILLIGLVGRVLANGPGDLGSNPGCVIPKTFKMVLDTSLLNTPQYKVRIKGKVKQSRERSSTLPQ